MISSNLEAQRAELDALMQDLYQGDRKILVHGEGNIGARVMLIGEAPGEQETLKRRPFVGKAGKNLDGFLAIAGLDRSDLYVSNAVKFRPTKISAAGRIVNRPPTREEIRLFLPWLISEIECVRPDVVVTLGNVPLHALRPDLGTIGDVHGGMIDCGAYRLYPMYHPASIIYNRSLRDAYERDIRNLAEYLAGVGV